MTSRTARILRMAELIVADDKEQRDENLNPKNSYAKIEDNTDIQVQIVPRETLWNDNATNSEGYTFDRTAEWVKNNSFNMLSAVSNYAHPNTMLKPTSSQLYNKSSLHAKNEDDYQFHTNTNDHECSGVSDSDIIEDEDKDKDFNVDSYSEENSSRSSISSHTSANDQLSAVIPIIKAITLKEPMSEQIKKKKMGSRKVVTCKYCNDDINTNNFLRHLQRNHGDEREIAEILKLPKNSKARRRALALLRNSINFDLYLKGTIRPSRQNGDKSSIDNACYCPCAYCKGLFLKKYLKRHVKMCLVGPKDGERNHISNSHTMTACALDPTDVISKLNVKEKVFDLMKGDEISFEAKKDILIAHFGESYLKKHRRERIHYVCSSRMRELARLLIGYRRLALEETATFKDLIHPNKFDMVISAVREIAGYDSIKKTFKAASLAMHLGTSLKLVCDELSHLILKSRHGFTCKTPEDANLWYKNVKRFKKLIESRWNIELASLANKDLQEKRWKKPLLLPLVNDIKLFREGILRFATECEKRFLEQTDDAETYKLLVQCSLALLIIFNRRRIGDVQFLKMEDYQNDKRSNYQDFTNILSETEKKLTKAYRRVLNSGKGSRAVVILIPESLKKLIDLTIAHRAKYISLENQYVFAIPGSTIKWGKGDVAIRSLTKKIKLENPDAISSNKLRKQIATVMQILNLTKDEAKQFSKFMGHTEKTHDEFYELPIDVYQTAKVSKLLLMMEKGSIPIEHKGKALSEINLDVDLEYAEEDAATEQGQVTDMENLAEKFQNISEEFDRCSNTNRNSARNVATTDASSNHSEGNATIKKKRKINRQGWSEKEIFLIKEKFNSFIEKKEYPKRDDLKKFIFENNIDRDITVVKAKLQHLIKLNTLNK